MLALPMAMSAGGVGVRGANGSVPTYGPYMVEKGEAVEEPVANHYFDYFELEN